MSAHYGSYPNPYAPQCGQAQGMLQGHQASAPAGYSAMSPQEAAYYAYASQQGAPYYAAQPTSPFFNFTNDRFLKGLLIGAAATYLLTNEHVQRVAIKGAVKAWSMVQGGVEELKERFQDAEAELRAAEVAGAAEGE